MKKNICIKLIISFVFMISLFFSNNNFVNANSIMNVNSAKSGYCLDKFGHISNFFDEITALMNSNYDMFRGLYASSDFKSLDESKVFSEAKQHLNDACNAESGKKIDWSADFDWVNSNFDEEFNTLNNAYKNIVAGSGSGNGGGNTKPGGGSGGSQGEASDIAKGALVTFFTDLRGQLSNSFNRFKKNYVIGDELNYKKIYSSCNSYIVSQLQLSGSEQEVARFNMSQLSAEFSEEYAALEDLYSSKLDKIERGEYEDVIDPGFFGDVDNCRKDLLGNEFADILDELFMIVRIVVPILMIVLIAKDFVVAVTAGKEDDMKKAQSTAIKRLIIGVIIFLLPTIVNVILGLIGLGVGTCGIG